jgi:hypothetical protein
MRRLRSDAAALERLREESSIFRYKCSGNPPQRYLITFYGKSLAREGVKVVVRDFHQVEIKLGSSYPRTIPELRWTTPIYHPNISEIGMVCLGGYGTHWVPSLRLDALCQMLWDMARYYNYDVRSPYNREAALWVAHQKSFHLPIDPRPLRDIRVAQGRTELAPPPAPVISQISTDQPAESTLPVEPKTETAPVAAEPEDPIVLVLDDTPQRPVPPSPQPVHAPPAHDDVLVIME